jgi:hypothetical protein
MALCPRAAKARITVGLPVPDIPVSRIRFTPQPPAGYAGMYLSNQVTSRVR